MERPPRLDLKLGDEVRLKLLRDKCYEGTNGYGTYYLYSVAHDGIEKSFFATPEIHEQILKNALKTGSEFILRKSASQNGKRVTATFSFEPVHAEKAAATPPNGNGNGKGHRTADTLKDIMLQSLEEAVEITRTITTVPFQNEDIQKIASCLFIARTRMN